LLTPEVEVDNGKGGKDGNNDLSQADSHCHNSTIDEKASHVCPVPDLGIVFKEMAGGKKFLRLLNDLINALGTHCKAIIEREPDEHEGENEKYVDSDLCPIRAISILRSLRVKKHQ